MPDAASRDAVHVPAQMAAPTCLTWVVAMLAGAGQMPTFHVCCAANFASSLGAVFTDVCRDIVELLNGTLSGFALCHFGLWKFADAVEILTSVDRALLLAAETCCGEKLAGFDSATTCAAMRFSSFWGDDARHQFTTRSPVLVIASNSRAA